MSDSAPWLANKLWRDNRIRSGAKGQLWGLGIGALAFCGVGVFLAIMLLPGLLAGNEDAVAWLAMVFPLAGIALVIAFVRSWLAWRRVGPVELELDPFPGSIDGQVGGTFWIDCQVHDDAPFEIGLDCMFSYLQRSNNKNERRRRSIWHKTGPGMLVTTGNSAAVQFRFDVPNSLPLSQEHLGEREYHFWQVSLRGHAGGRKLDRIYTVPVFASGVTSSLAYDSGAARAESDSGTAERLRKRLDAGDYDQTPLANHAAFERSRETLEIRQPILRNRFIGAFAVVFAVVAGLMAQHLLRQPVNGAVDAEFSLGVLVPALVAVLAGLGAVYLLFNSLHTRVDRSGVWSRRKVLGIKVREQQLPAGDIASLSLHRSGSTGNGSRQIEHLDVRAETADQQHVTLIEGIDHRQPADAMRRHLADILGVAS